MNAKKLYEMKPEGVTKDLYALQNMYIDFIPEIKENIDKIEGLNERIEIKTVASYEPEWEIAWEINTVWFDGIPVMVTQHAGKRGDHQRRYLTNEKVFQEMILYIRSLLHENETWDDDIYDENEDLLELTGFYGYRLNEETREVEDDGGTEIWNMYVGYYIGETDMNPTDKENLRTFASRVILYIKEIEEVDDVVSSVYYLKYKGKGYHMEMKTEKGVASLVQNKDYQALQNELQDDITFHHALQILKNKNESDIVIYV